MAVAVAARQVGGLPLLLLLLLLPPPPHPLLMHPLTREALVGVDLVAREPLRAPRPPWVQRPGVALPLPLAVQQGGGRTPPPLLPCRRPLRAATP